MTASPGPPTQAQRWMLGAIVAILIVVALLYLAFGLLTASTTLGCDYGSYAGAASRFLAGEPIYLPGPARTGECPLFPYPPPFVLLVLPFVAIGGAAGMWAWIAASWLSFVVGTVLLPVERWVRLLVFLLGSIGWPLIFGVRIGQVVPMLFLVFALGWRWIDRDRAFGAVAGLGTLIKVQPGLVLIWLAARLQLAALAAAAVTMVAISLAALVVGLDAWPEFLRTVVQISDAADVPANLSIGAVLFRAGVPIEAANLIQTVNTVAVLGLTVVSARVLAKVPGFLVVAVASQVLTPIVWSHYALITLLPVAWLLQRRQWWALVLPAVQAWMLIGVMPEVAYTLSFYAAIAAVFLVARRTPGSEPAPVRAMPALSA